MTRDYGNYEKYDNNSIEQTKERGENDFGNDRLMKNENELNMRLATLEGEQARDGEKQKIESLLSNENYADQTIRDRLTNMKNVTENPQDVMARDHEQKMMKGFESQDIAYNGRMSPVAKEELYRNYLKGMTIKDLSLKYGCLP